MTKNHKSCINKNSRKCKKVKKKCDKSKKKCTRIEFKKCDKYSIVDSSKKSVKKYCTINKRKLHNRNILYKSNKKRPERSHIDNKCSKCKCPKGDKGDRGVPGPQGAPGPRGTAGQQGVPGDSGLIAVDDDMVVVRELRDCPTGGSGFHPVFYNPTTNELCYDSMPPPP